MKRNGAERSVGVDLWKVLNWIKYFNGYRCYHAYIPFDFIWYIFRTFFHIQKQQFQTKMTTTTISKFLTKVKLKSNVMQSNTKRSHSWTINERQNIEYYFQRNLNNCQKLNCFLGTSVTKIHIIMETMKHRLLKLSFFIFIWILYTQIDNNKLPKIS